MCNRVHFSEPSAAETRRYKERFAGSFLETIFAMILETILAPNICFVVSLQESKMLHLHEGIGVCEQLMGIPIPLSYTRLTSRFLVFWHLTLPIILWDECHWIVVPATFISAASLFCIEEVGFSISSSFA